MQILNINFKIFLKLKLFLKLGLNSLIHIDAMQCIWFQKYIENQRIEVSVVKNY